MDEENPYKSPEVPSERPPVDSNAQAKRLIVLLTTLLTLVLLWAWLF